MITQACAGFDDVAPIGVAIERFDQVGAAIDAVLPMRRSAAGHSGTAYAIERVAAQYRSLVSSVLQVAA